MKANNETILEDHAAATIEKNWGTSSRGNLPLPCTTPDLANALLLFSLNCLRLIGISTNVLGFGSIRSHICRLLFFR